MANPFNFPRFLLVIFLLPLSLGVMAEAYVIKPEVIRAVDMSATDVNRIHCTNGEINDVVFSEEKGVTVKKVNQNAFVKFLIKIKQGVKSYVTEPTEFHVVCDGLIYTIIAKPRPGEPVIVRLSNDTKSNIKDNIQLFSGMEREEAIVKITLDILKDDAAKSYRIVKRIENNVEKHIDNNIVKNTPHDNTFNIYNEVQIRPIKRYYIDGVGMIADEYIVTANVDLPYINENYFIHPRFGKQILGITLLPQPLKQNQSARLVIIDGSVKHGE